MAQERFWNWKDDDSTFRLNWRDLIIIPYGLYGGFDADLNNGMTLTLQHNSAGLNKVKKDLSVTPDLGIWKSKQGVVVVEDSPIQLPISTGTGKPRIDLIVAEHEYIETTGGATAVYKVIQGTPAPNPTEPVLTYPTKQVILGRLRVPAYANNLLGATYTKEPAPDFNGDNTIMHTDKVQTSTALKVFNVQRGEMVVSSLNNTGIADTSIQSNFYALLNFSNTARYLDFNGFSNHLTGAGQSVTFFTSRALKINSGGSLLVPDGSVYVEANSTFTFLDITGAVGSNRLYVLTKGGEVTRSRFLNKVGGLFGWNKGKNNLAVSSNNISLKFVEGNYMKFDFAGVIKSMDSVARISQTPNTDKADEGGTILILQSLQDCTFRHDDPTTVTNSKPIWLPTEQTEWLCKSGTHIMLIEDFTHWRVMSVWNSELTSLEVPIPPKLISLLDTLITGGTTTNPTPANHVLYSDGNNVWRNRDFKEWIETTNIKMKRTIEFGMMRFDSPTDVPMIEVSGEQGLNIPSNGNVVALNSLPVPTTIGNYGTPVLRQIDTDLYGLQPFSWTLSVFLGIEYGLNTDINTCRLYYRQIDTNGNAVTSWYSDGSSVYDGTTVYIDAMFMVNGLEFRLGVNVTGSTNEIFSNIIQLPTLQATTITAPPSVQSIITNTGGSVGYTPDFKILPASFQEGTEIIVLFGATYNVEFNSNAAASSGWIGIRGMGNDQSKSFSAGEVCTFVRQQTYWKAIYTKAQNQSDWNVDNVNAPDYIKNKPFKKIQFVSGQADVPYNLGGQQQGNFNANQIYVYPPTGFTIYDLVAFMPSISIIYFNGDVDDNDTLWCRHQVQYANNRIVVICNNSEHRWNAQVNWISCWLKQ